MEDNIFENNIVTVAGEIAENFVFSHEVFGIGFYTSKLAVKRLSEVTDYVPITVSERLVDVKEDWVGQYVKIRGQFRSFNLYLEEKRKLELSVFARDMEVLDELHTENEIFLDGYICKEPVYRKTPLSGREIADLLLRVNRSYGKSDYIPCIFWGRNAGFVSSLEVGTHVQICGRIQSREHVKRISETETETRVAYEVSVSKVEV